MAAGRFLVAVALMFIAVLLFIATIKDNLGALKDATFK